MPSNQDPALVVLPGPGKIPAGVVPAGALVPPGGGGGGGAFAALQAHITNPIDAHMASAIGVAPYYPPNVGPTPDPILSRVGGPIDGESVLDFINEMKDLVPPRPNSIGFNLVPGVTTGIPNWNNLNQFTDGGQGDTGAYDASGNVQFSHYIVNAFVTSTGVISGMLFPADRGVICLYKNTSGNFLDASSTTLVAALWMGDGPIPAGIPGAIFNETVRQGKQADYVPSGTGLDQFGLTFRLPFLTDYTPYAGTPFGPFSANFYRYQLAEFSLLSQTIGVGNSQSFLLVHWRETFATTLAAIQPASLTLHNLSAMNCYSAVPTSNTSYASGSWDDPTNAAFNVNRHFVFQDANSGLSPVGSSFTSSPVGIPPTQDFSGVPYYINPNMEWNVDIQATNMSSNTFQTGSADYSPNIPVGQHSVYDPIQMDFTFFGGAGYLTVPYFYLNKLGGAQYSITNAPAPGDTVEFVASNTSPFGWVGIPGPAVAAMPPGGYTQLTAFLRNVFHEQTYADTTNYLFNSYANFISEDPTSSTFEPFFTENYRYPMAFDPTTSSTVSLIPSGGNIFPSSTPFVVTGPDLQVAGQLQYPQTNYASGTFFPNTGPNYSGFPAGDGTYALRRFQRAVDTGLPLNTGWIRLRGLAQSAFTTNAAYNGTETTGHISGGAIIQLKVPGAAGSDWLDLGRQSGDPGLVGALGTSPFYGCATGVVISGQDIYVSFNLGPNFTSNNGSGNYLLFVRVSYVNGSGTTLALSQLQFYPPTFVPP